MGNVDLTEVIGWFSLAAPTYEKIKESIDALETVPKEQRRPSHYIACGNTILAALAPLADKVEEDIKD